MKLISIAFLLAIVLTFHLAIAQDGQNVNEPIPARVYPVDKRVSDFSATDDFSTPERGYASIHHRLVAGDSDWKAMSVTCLAPVLPKPPEKPTPLGERAARGYLDARIVEVRQASDTIAYVIGQWPTSGSFDIRCMELEAGQWLNAGDNQANTIDAARKSSESSTEPRRSGAPFRKTKLYPQSYLQQFSDFLVKSSQEPKDFLLKSLADHQLVIVGDVPHRPTYWKWLADAVEDPRFVQSVGVVFVQLPSNEQALMDKFLNSDSPDELQLMELLRDADWMGNPDQAMHDFFTGVFKANQNQPKEKRIRVVLIAPQRPWKLIREPADLRAYDVNGDEYMAYNVLRDRLNHANDSRHALMIVDFTNAAKNLRWRADDSPVKTAGWHLSQVLGDQCYAILEHLPQISGRGSVSGLAARGLFDSAFRAIEYKPVGFALGNNPFGGEPFDVTTELDFAGSYLDGFDGYVFVERLEEEFTSPMLGDFYTDDFVKEIDRRHKITQGKTLAEELGFEEINARDVIRWLDQTWGQPRSWKQNLGSIDAWQIGQDGQMAQ